MLSYANHKCSSKPKTSQQDVVKLLCKHDGIKKIAVKKSNVVTKEEDHLVCKCSKGDECKKDGETHLQKNMVMQTDTIIWKVVYAMGTKQS